MYDVFEFLFSIFLAPLVSVIPSEAAVPALVLVGFLMMQQVAGMSWTTWRSPSRRSSRSS